MGVLFGLAALLGASVWGCVQGGAGGLGEAAGAGGFGARRVRLLPAFTRMEAPGPEDSGAVAILAFVELADGYGDPIKALGTFRFEIFQYRPAVSDPRGKRLEVDGMQEFDLSDSQANQEYWDSITRSYRIGLTVSDLPGSVDKLALQVTFLTDRGERLRDIMVLSLLE